MSACRLRNTVPRTAFFVELSARANCASTRADSRSEKNRSKAMTRAPSWSSRSASAAKVLRLQGQRPSFARLASSMAAMVTNRAGELGSARRRMS
ncbi:hypothetical protein D3C83_75980 [compost metagenome]